MKLLMSALLLVLSFSCAHQQSELAQTTSNPRFPASDADTQDLTKMTNQQILGYTGKNVLRIGAACPISAFTLVLTSVAETIPMLSAMTSMSVDMASGSKYDFVDRDKTATNHVGGSVVGVAVDLTKVGYALLFEDSKDFSEKAFTNAKASFPATRYLAQKFYSEEGDCGLAGRRLVDTLTEIQRRQSKK